jgi:hypothetical protein
VRDRILRSNVEVGDVFVYEEGDVVHESYHVILEVEFRDQRVKKLVKREVRFKIFIFAGPRAGEVTWSVWQRTTTKTSPYERLVTRGKRVRPAR